MSRFVLTAQLQLQAPNNVAQVVRQIQSQLNNVNVNLNIQNAARTQRQLQQITTQTQAAGTAADRMGRAFALSVRRFAAFSIATRAVGLFTSTLSKAVQTAIDFERELVKISQVTGESISKLKGLTNTIGELSTSLGVSSTSLIGVSRILSQAGFKANELDIALKTLAKTELAPTFDDITQTAEGAIAIFNQFGQGAEALERQLGAINAVAGKFAVEAGDLIDVVRRAGGVFKSSGGELNELIALFTSVRATTRESAESIGTGLRTIFTRIQRPKTIEFLKQFGVELVDLEGKFVGPFEAVRRLSAALAGLEEGDLTFIRIAEELGGFRQIGKVLPLLQQFSVAQNALNVANKAGNSLTEDAAKAQQALAVRIMKVKEEFLALVRGITETKTFQIMANTALSLAEALIKIGEAIKPLLPLLTALAAVNFARGIGTFAGGLMRGMQSGRTYNKGGKVHHFARGGMVPGTGNRDTVPAMLQPGEFVIKKSSVNQLGASNLAAMNENKLNKGGVPTLTARNALIGQRRLTPAEMIKASRRAGYDIERLDNGRIALSRNGKIYHNNLTDDEASKLLASMGTGYNRGTTGRGIVGATAQLKSVEKRKTPYSAKEPFPGTGSLRFNVNEGQIGAFVLQPAKGTEGFYKPNKAIDFVLPPTNKYAQVAAKQAGLDPSKDISGGVKAVLNPGSYPVFYPGMEEGRANLKKNAKYASAVTRGFNDAISSGVNSTIQSVVSQGLLDMPPAYNTNENLLKNTISSIQSDNQVRGSIEGYLFEGMISAFTGAQAAGGRASFDFPRSAISQNKDKLATLFGSPQMINKLIKAEAKRSYGEVSGVTNKLINDIKVNKIGGVSIQTVGKKFASGGGVGTDTVPALLTPGEFVVNKKSAQAIGYGSLNRMNKVGKYAKGGVVQGFNTGTTGTGVKSSGGLSFPGFDSKPLSMLQKAILDITTTFSTGSQIANKVNSKWKMIDNSVPALANALDRYISRLGLTDKQAIYLTEAYANLVSKMVKEGATTDEMTARLADYIHSLQAATKAHNRTATQTVSPSSPPVSTPIGPFGSIPRQAAAQAAAQAATTNSGAGGPVPQNTQAVVANTKAQRGAAKSAIEVVSGNKMFAASIATSLISGFLPAVNENSGAMLKLTHSALGLVTTIASVGFALEAFGIKLKKQAVMDFLGGKGGAANKATDMLGLNRRAIGQRAGFLQSQAGGGMSRFGALKQAATESKAGFGFTGQGVGKFTAGLGKATQGLVKLAGPLVAIAGSAYLAAKAFSTVIESVYNFEGRLKTSIESGDVEKAKAVAAERASFEGANVVRGGGATAGAVIGFILGGPIGAAIGAGLGAAVGTLVANLLPEGVLDTLNIMFGGNTRDSAVALAASQAGAVKTQKELEKAQKAATNAMQDFENGSISASEALSRIRAATAEVAKQEKRASDFAVKNLDNRGGTFRDVVTLGGLLGESSSVRNERLGNESAEQIRQAAKFQAEAFALEFSARSASIRSGFARGRSRSEIEAESTGNLRTRRTELLQGAQKALRAGDEITANALNAAAQELADQIDQVEREMNNLEKEVARSKAAFEAMNLGLRGASATASAMSASMNRFVAGLEVGGSTFVANAEFLSTAMTSAAQAMNPDTIKAAISDVSENLRSMGVSGQAISKFESNTNALVQAQQNYGAAFEKIRADMEARRSRGEAVDTSPEALKNAFAKELTVGLGDEAKQRLTAIIENIELSGPEVDAILGGRTDIFGEKLGEAGQKFLDEIVKIAQERQKAEQVVIGLIQQRAEAERNLAQAQKDAIDIIMEARNIQAQYGGAPVSMQERRGAILGRANAGARTAGLREMRTGSVAELRQMNMQILAGFARIESRRSVDGGMKGAGGAEADITQKNLQQAQKDQVQTIRELIKLEQEELKILQEKNKLEKDSLESLITGDIEKFFEQQAALGAQASIAAGNMEAANMFGAKAVADAFKDLQRQMDAGVQSLFGRQLGGAGGLLESAAGAALAGRGVTDPRMAQRLAGTTAEEEEFKARIRDLSDVLGEAALTGQAMAEMQVQTAEINVSNAKIELDKIEERGRRVAGGFAKGGTVYANRGMFVPRGTDTVPAMLTPGEFVVRREAVNRGNNLQMLKAINGGSEPSTLARGGKVGYYNTGGRVSGSSLNPNIGIDPTIISNLSGVFDKFINGFNESIKNLRDTKLQVKLDSVNVNVNFTGTSMLTQISNEARSKIIDEVVQKLKSEYGVRSDGKIGENKSLLPRPGG